MSDDPFAEPDDDDRTVFRPMPGGRRAAPAVRPPGPAKSAPPSPAPRVAPTQDPLEPAPLPPGPPLAAAAAPLLQLLARLRNTARPPDPGDLHQRAVRAFGIFEQQARAAGVPMEQVRPAHYALCAAIDDVVLATPWGAAEWAKRRLAATLHQDTAESRFFELLARLQKDPAKFMPVIEIMYVCLSLGFMGRYRQIANGAAEMERVRAATGALVLAQRPGERPDLSERWRGIAAPYQPRRGGIPVWVVFVAALAACCGLFIWVSGALNAASDEHYARMLAVPPGHMPEISRAVEVQPPPPPPPPPEPTAFDRLAAALQRDVASGAVSIVGTPATPIVRVANLAGFVAGSATLQPVLAQVLERVGAALRPEPGRVQVIAYTDNQPIRTVKFPSNFQLSSARAAAASGAIARGLGDATRLSAEGRADADPIASNATAEGRERNRRIDVVLHRQE